VLADIARDVGARVVLLSGDERGSEIGPRLAERLGGTALTHVLGVEANGSGQVVWTRPVFGGKALAAVVATAEPAVATLRRGAFEPAEPTGGTAAVETRTAPPPGDLVQLAGTDAPGAGVPIDQATVVVAGGRGLGSGGEFARLEELAGLLNGAVGASLGAVDEGWAAQDRQVGLTGKTVSPDVYFAIGISGASQHLAGIGGAKAVVAVNTDAQAPIFGAARLGVVMDCKAFLPALIEELRRRAAR
jgi:electron transfer flavoprotein alpha subunit